MRSINAKNIESQIETLELAMKLEVSPIDDGIVGMVHIQLQLDNMMIQL